MATLTPGSTLTVAEDGDRYVLRVDGEDRGRVRGLEVELGDVELTLERTGERHRLVTSTGTPVLRFDPAGRKATTLTLSAARYRLARQRPRPLLHRWLLTRGMHGDPVLTVSRTPLGTRLAVAEATPVAPEELDLLALGSLVEVLELDHALAAA